MTGCTVCSILDIVLNIQQSTFLKFLEILYLLHVVNYFVGNKIQTNSFEMYIYASYVKKSFNTYHDQETSNCIFELGTMTYQIYNALKLFMQMTFFVNEIRIKLQGKKVLMFKTIYIKKCGSRQVNFLFRGACTCTLKQELIINLTIGWVPLLSSIILLILMTNYFKFQ